MRAYLGYERLDSVAQVLALNALYDQMWVFYNFFQPVMRLEEKIIIPGDDAQLAQVKRRYDDARPPFDRVCDTQAIPRARREPLDALRDRTNPRQLRQDIYDWIEYIRSLPKVVPGITEDVHLTLRAHDLEEGGGVLFGLPCERTTTLR